MRNRGQRRLLQLQMSRAIHRAWGWECVRVLEVRFDRERVGEGRGGRSKHTATVTGVVYGRTLKVDVHAK